MTCDPATCENGKCNATGECIEAGRPSERHVPRPMVGFWNGLTAEQKKLALEYDGDETQGPGRTIVAFTGLAGSGKSTAAQYLVERHGFQRVRFAGPLKSMMAALGCSHEQIDGSEKETPCDLLGGKTPRQAMQTLGTEWGRDLITPDIWIRAWQAAVAKVPAGVPIVVDDCRFPNEGDAVRAAGGVIVCISRPGAGTASVHSSEQHQIDAAETLHNVADKRYLFDMVDLLVTDSSWQDTVAA